jgi:hypothetical protein
MLNPILVTGVLYRVNNYVFDDDLSNKDKYMIVIHVDSENIFIIDTLTTSQNHTKSIVSKFGCHIKPFHFFYFPKLNRITDLSFFFDLDTYLFFKNNIRKEEISKFEKLKTNSKLAIAYLGNLNTSILKELLLCMIQSGSIPIGINQIIIDELKKLSSR